MKKRTYIVLFGPPGAGKGTQSAKLVEKYSFCHISTGDLFRFHIQKATPLGLKVKNLVDSGILIPDNLTISMLEEEIEKNPEARGFIFDGFPRTIPQAEALDRFLEKQEQKIDLVLELLVNQQTIKNRIAERAKVSGRIDDSAEKLLIRIDEYFAKTIHVLPYYEQQKKVKKIQGIGEIDLIFNELCSEIDSIK